MSEVTIFFLIGMQTLILVILWDKSRELKSIKERVTHLQDMVCEIKDMVIPKEENPALKICIKENRDIASHLIGLYFAELSNKINRIFSLNDDPVLVKKATDEFLKLFWDISKKEFKKLFKVEITNAETAKEEGK